MEYSGNGQKCGDKRLKCGDEQDEALRSEMGTISYLC